MKIVYLNPSGNLGGAERSLLEILGALRRTQPDWSLDLIVASEGPLVSKAESLGVPTQVIPFPKTLAQLGDFGASRSAGKRRIPPGLILKLCFSALATISYVRQLKAYLKKFEPNLIHTNGFKMHLIGLWSRPKGIPVIWHIHDYVRSRPVMGRLLPWHARRCSAIITNSRSVARDVESLGSPPGRIHVIYNGVDLNYFSPTGPALDLDLLSGIGPAQPGTVRVGLVGTFARWKGHEVFLKAVSRLPRELPLRAYIIGQPLYLTANSQYTLEELKARASQLGVLDRVGFAGFVENPAAALRALDIVVHASTQPEPFGLVIVEAMACGRPVIVSQAGGAEEIIDPGVNALACFPGDSEALAKRMTELVLDRELRLRLGKAGRLAAESRFNASRLPEELIPIYQNLTSSVHEYAHPPRP